MIVCVTAPTPAPQDMADTRGQLLERSDVELRLLLENASQAWLQELIVEILDDRTLERIRMETTP